MLSSLPALSSQAFPSVLSAAKPGPRRKTERLFAPLSSDPGARERDRRVLLGFRRRDSGARNWDGVSRLGWSGFVRRCVDWDSDSDFALEAEILEFMTRSEKPAAFPSKKELVDGGRMDLVDAIVKKGGWMALGWDLEEEGEEGIVRGFNDHGGFEELDDSSSGREEETRDSAMVSSCPYDDDYSQPASSSGRSLEMATAENETGIEGILSRLEKERNFTFGFGARENEDQSFFERNDGNEGWLSKFSTDATVGGFSSSNKSSSLSPKKAIFDKSGDRLNQNLSFSDADASSNSHKLDTWRAWSIQRAGVLDINSQDTEVASSETTSMGRLTDISKDGKQRLENATEPGERNHVSLKKHEEINHNQLRSRLQHLELALSSILRAVRSNADEIVMQKDMESSSDDLQKLSDAWEFQENEILNAQDKLRSTRAKLAVLEGKLALALIDAQKIMEEKQRRIDDARRALHLLRSTCIVWPNSASVVLLAGSFDGWESKRKMEKSRTGIFSLWLRLYPGRYEIKFIVDGEWRIDPLRPVVNNNGHENNLLIIT